MNDRRRIAEDCLARLAERIARPRAIEFDANAKQRIEKALARCRAQLLGGDDAVLTIAIAGGTGAGKSTLINALAGSRIAETSAARPTTTQIRVYHHDTIAAGGLPDEIGVEAHYVPHDRDELRLKVIVDTPDLDSFLTEHRRITTRLLKRAGLVLYVFSPEKYLEERTWSVLREERCFSVSAAVLNKSDRLSEDELERVTKDLRARFAEVGLPDIRIFRTSARAHLGEAQPGPVDEFEQLRAFIEKELEEAEVMRMLRAQQARVLEHFEAEIDEIAPSAMLDRLSEAAVEASTRADAASSSLATALAPELHAIETDLAPLAIIKQHERFYGPFRTWLTISDFFRFGLSSLVQRLLGHKRYGPQDIADRLLARSRRSQVEDTLRAESRAVQDLLYSRGLPITRWHEHSGNAETDAGDALAEVASEIRAHFDARASAAAERGGRVVHVASLVGGVVPGAFVLGALWVMTRDLVAGQYAGLPLLGHLLAMCALFFVVLQMVIAVFLPATRDLGVGVCSAAIRVVVGKLTSQWFARYKQDVEADLDDLHRPITELRERLKLEKNLEPLPAPVAQPDRVLAPSEPEPEPEPTVEPTPESTAPAERMRRALGD